MKRVLFILALLIPVLSFGQFDGEGRFFVTDGHNHVYLDPVYGVVLYDSTVVWRDLQGDVTQLKSVGVSDKPDFNKTTLTLDFPEDTTEQVGHTYQMDHDLAEGYDSIYPHIHWEQEQNVTPVFYLEYIWTNIGDTTIARTRIRSKDLKVIPYVDGTLHQILVFPGIYAANKKISSALKTWVYRKSDSYTGDVRVIFMDIHCPVDGLGSKDEYIK